MLMCADAEGGSRSGSTTQPSGRGRAFLTGNIFVRHVQELCRSRQSIPRDHPGVSKVRLIKRPVKRTPRKKLRAAGQRSAAKYAEEDYSAEEPNVKLSRAFVVVLLLHIVAVGGIFAFSALKDQQTNAAAGKVVSANGKPAALPSKAARDPGIPDKPGSKALSSDL